MRSESEIFRVSGPTHLNSVDWSCDQHRRCVLASVVKGVYTLERDRQRNRVRSKSLAPPWWENFHFRLTATLVDSADGTICGAILHLNLPPGHPAVGSPEYVVAFRGTLISADTGFEDFRLDLKCILNNLHRSSRFDLALCSIRNVVAKAGPCGVWLAGHSLGSAIALLAGRRMARSGYNLPTYLFNSPFPSALLERIKCPKLKKRIHTAGSVAKAGFSAVLKHLRHKRSDRHDDDDNGGEGDGFEALAKWMPLFFVNPNDHICSGYIGYYELREEMNRIGASKIERMATQHTVVSLVRAALGRKSEPFHLLPCAELVINMGQTTGFRAAHGIKQWWHPELRCHSRPYCYKQYEPVLST